jgi:hypothetical protein
MLVQFVVRNFKTFKEQATLSLFASNSDKDFREEENIIAEDKFNLRVLKSAVIFGANASGKSRFIEALMFMRNFVLTSSKEGQKGDEIEVDPFRLCSSTENAASEFEVIFLHENIMYRYGFEVDKERVVSEWLYYRPHTKEVELFYREKQEVETHARKFNKGAAVVKGDLLRDNALLLSVAAQFNDGIAINVVDWFRRLQVVPGLRELGYQAFTVDQTRNPKSKEKILELLKAADLGIQDLKLQAFDAEKLPEDMPVEVREYLMREFNNGKPDFFHDVLTMRKKYDDSGKYVGDIVFSLDDDESSGTQKFFALTGPILNALENGYTLVVDELDSKLHPNLVCKIVSLFNSKESNPHNAQLIFNTHDTNLLSSGLFRRDQIWFADKDKFGAARLYSLADFKSKQVRKYEAFEENYLRGKYGGIPFLGFFEDLADKSMGNEDEKQEG